jgi:hypothetical protein
MGQRAKEFGGELQLRDGKLGTLVEVTIPIEPSALQSKPVIE